MSLLCFVNILRSEVILPGAKLLVLNKKINYRLWTGRVNSTIQTVFMFDDMISRVPYSIRFVEAPPDMFWERLG